MTYDEVKKIVGGGYDFGVSPIIGGRVWQHTTYWNVANKSNSISQQVRIIFTPGYIVKSKSNPFGW